MNINNKPFLGTDKIIEIDVLRLEHGNIFVIPNNRNHICNPLDLNKNVVNSYPKVYGYSNLVSKYPESDPNRYCHGFFHPHNSTFWLFGVSKLCTQLDFSNLFDDGDEYPINSGNKSGLLSDNNCHRNRNNGQHFGYNNRQNNRPDIWLGDMNPVFHGSSDLKVERLRDFKTIFALNILFFF